MKMYMTPADIAKEYREAKHKKTQIEILADQNCCTKEAIKDVLRAQGIKLQGDRTPEEAKRKPAKANPEFEQAMAEMTKGTEFEPLFTPEPEPVADYSGEEARHYLELRAKQKEQTEAIAVPSRLIEGMEKRVEAAAERANVPACAIRAAKARKDELLAIFKDIDDELTELELWLKEVGA